jgi:glucoamylase
VSSTIVDASGWPGIPARWTSSAKSGVGTSLGHESRLWFTLSHGIVNEVFYPRIDRACIRDLGFIVTDASGFFSEEKRHATHSISCTENGVPAFRLLNSCTRGRYRIEKDICCDPDRPALLQRIRLTPLADPKDALRLFVLLAPHLGNRGAGNTGWVDEYKGVPMLFAERDGSALALACSVPWLERTVGFVGSSDGWRDLHAHGRLTSPATRAENGNVALSAQIDWPTANHFVVALAFGRTAAEAGFHARAALQSDFDATQAEYVRRWQDWQGALLPLDSNRAAGNRSLYRASTMVMRVHQAAQFRGGLIASLSVPWGFSRGDDDLGGYHLVWPRDLVESAVGLLAAGAHEEVRGILGYLRATQKPDGQWAQNMWLDGTPYWNGVQMDETALPILLVDLAQREQTLSRAAAATFWPMVRRAAGYLVRNGPLSPQDRWEEDAGYSAFTVSAEIASLLAAADLADANAEPLLGVYLRETADAWNDAIDRWLYARRTDWCGRFGVDGYYVRIATTNKDGASPSNRTVVVKNVASGQASRRSAHLVSPDALALVRFGLRAADDPRILNTVKIVDALLKTEMPHGPCWHRYNGDGYGEHRDGAPFDGTGIGRAWPLLTLERAHYELSAGRRAETERLLDASRSFASAVGLLPEQIWDAPDVPERELYFGRPSGSAMPLVWAHAEYVKLYRSLRDGRVFDLPPQTVKRYLVDRIVSPREVWRFNHRIHSVAAGKSLRIEVLAPAVVHWSADGWSTVEDVATRDVGLGTHVADLSAETLAQRTAVRFTFYWPSAARWEGSNFVVGIDAAPFRATQAPGTG